MVKSNIALSQARKLYDAFKKLHPNSTDEFVVTDTNLHRWNYHVNAAKNRSIYLVPGTTKALTAAKSIAKNRAIRSWSKMPLHMKERFLEIAQLYPQYQFYAVGSRVNGDYIDRWDGQEIVRMREELGKTEKQESDYDVWVDWPTLEEGKRVKGELAGIADVLLQKTYKNKVKIPMWDWSKLPKSEHPRVVDLFKRERWGELMLIHNAFKLSEYEYCCNELPIIRHFKHAIDSGIISNSEQKGK